MPDILLPQVSSAPAPAKPAQASARSAEAKSETESNQGFSKVLKSQMQPENEAAQADAEARGTTEEAAAGGAAADAAEGNSLPPGGKDAASTAVVLDPLLLNAEAATESQDIAVEVPVEATVAVTGLPGEALPEPLVPATAATEAANKQPSASAAAAQMRNGPWNIGAAELPAPAQSAVAQAVRSAVAELDGNAQQNMPFEHFGAEVRAAASARPGGLETMLDRLTANNAPQPTTPANGAAAQGVQTLVAQDAATARPTLPTTAVETPLRQPGWDQALSERVLWVANQKFQGAEIKLTPAHLGPIEVRVQMHNDQAQISFTAQHAPAREALEAALPRLREMFAANGYNLVDVNVSQHSFAEQQRHAQGFEGRFQGGAREEDEAGQNAGLALAAGRQTGLPSGAIDLFA